DREQVVERRPRLLPVARVEANVGHLAAQPGDRLAEAEFLAKREGLGEHRAGTLQLAEIAEHGGQVAERADELRRMAPPCQLDARLEVADPTAVTLHQAGDAPRVEGARTGLDAIGHLEDL